MEPLKRPVETPEDDVSNKRAKPGEEPDFSSSDESWHPDTESEEEEVDAPVSRLIKTRSRGPASPPPAEMNINEVMDATDDVVDNESDFSSSTEEESEEEEDDDDEDDDLEEEDESDTEDDGYSDDDSFVTSDDEDSAPCAECGATEIA
jgi:ribonuclease E